MLWYRPIRVFCFHQVSDEFEPDTMSECDWTQTEVFKDKILALKKRYTFVSLEAAYQHIANDKVRFKKYASLTADDGWASLKNILPWLAEQGIPVTLFLNPSYLDGKHFQWRDTEKLLTHEEVISLVKEYNPMITIASHGWRHEKCEKMSDKEFEVNVQTAEAVLNEMPGKVPFYAFTYGYFLCSQIKVLRELHLIPVLVADDKNYCSPLVYRECIDEGFKLSAKCERREIALD